MKKLLVLGIWLLFALPQSNAQGVHVSVGFQTFYDQLSPYGTWVNNPQYGYVWRYRPASGEFRPYSTGGHWVYTDEGWTWVSDYDWGWAPFHYGRWTYDNGLGWLWIPGNEWAPAWVTWGTYNDNFAWAPIGPGISISIGSSYRPPANYWSVCPGAYFGRSDWQSHAIRNEARATIVNKVTIINNYHRPEAGRPGYFRGPDTHAVERYTKAPIHAARIADAPRPNGGHVQNNSVALYRPQVRDDRKNARPPAPSKPADAGQLRQQHSNVPLDPNHGRGTAVPANRPSDAFKPREAGKNPAIPGQPRPAPAPNPVHPQQQPRPVDPNVPSRPEDRRPENRPANPRPARPNRPQPAPQQPGTPVSPAPVNPATDRRPESGKNLPQRPQQPAPVNPQRPQQPRPQPVNPQPRPAQPVNRPQPQQMPHPNPPQNRPPVQQQPRPAEPHPVPQQRPPHAN